MDGDTCQGEVGVDEIGGNIGEAMALFENLHVRSRGPIKSELCSFFLVINGSLMKKEVGSSS